MSTSERRERHEALLQELNAERVAALTRIARTLEQLIAELALLGPQLSSSTGEERPQMVERYRALRQRALKYRWYLEVQREALGLRRHRFLDELYAIPGPIDA